VVVVLAAALLWFRPGEHPAHVPRIPQTKAAAEALYGEPEQGWRPVKPNEFSGASAVRGDDWPNANRSGERRIVCLDADDRVTGLSYFGSLLQHKRWFKEMWCEEAEQ
jgi:hypothetical protein